MLYGRFRERPYELARAMGGFCGGWKVMMAFLGRGLLVTRLCTILSSTRTEVDGIRRLGGWEEVNSLS